MTNEYFLFHSSWSVLSLFAGDNPPNQGTSSPTLEAHRCGNYGYYGTVLKFVGTNEPPRQISKLQNLHILIDMSNLTELWS